MKIFVKVIPNAKTREVTEDSTDIFGERRIKIKVCEPPEDGRANFAVIRLISEYFNVSKSKVKILKGEKSREKLIEIIDYPRYT